MIAIRPGEGLGDVRFGMSPSQVAEAMGNEETRWEAWMGGNLNNALTYRGLIFEFDRMTRRGPASGARLIGIQIEGREGVTLFERSMGDWSRPELVEELRARGFEPRDGPQGDVNVAEIGLFTSFEGGRLCFVELRPPKVEDYQRIVDA